ncbi:hypothetical protein BH11ACT6_BH11ACT6_53540 [soil metagenome]
MMFALGVLVAATPGVASAEPGSDAGSSASSSEGGGGTGADSDSAPPRSKSGADRGHAGSTPRDDVDDDTNAGIPDGDTNADDDTTADESDVDDTATEEPQAHVDDAADDEPETVRRSRQPGSKAEVEASATPTESVTDSSPVAEPADVDAATPVSQAPPEAVVTSVAATQTATVTTVAEERAQRRPVNAATIARDVLTWIGLGPMAGGLPVPAVPVPGLLEMLWVAVRQTQYTWNNQRPTAQPTLTGQGDDGVVTGELNAVDYDDAQLTYVVAAPAKFGTVVVDQNGKFTYTPRAGTTAGTDTFTISVSDVPGNGAHVHGLAGLFGQTGPTTATVTVNFAAPAINDSSVVRPGAVTVQMGTDGRISVIDGTFTDTKVFDKAGAVAVLNSYASILKAQSGFATTDSITVHRVGASGVAEEYYRLRQTVNGVEVVGGDVVLVTDGNGTVTGLFNYHDSRINDVDTTPELAGGSTVAALAAAHLINSTGLKPSRAVTRLLTTDVADAELVILALDKDAAPSLAWRVELPVATYYIRANGEDAGEVISATTTAQPATTVGRDIFGVNRTINVAPAKWWFFFNSQGLNDTTRNIKTYATGYSFFGIGQPFLPGTISTRSLLLGWNASGVSAHANMAEVYDYYAAVLGRDSYDGLGATVVSSVGYNPRTELLQYFSGYTNAFWDAGAQQFAFGNTGAFEGALDIVAHEFTHGVVSYVVSDGGSVLDYGESGALNEAYADVLGSLIEGKTGTGRWLIGEDTSGGAIRSMANPTAVGRNYRASYATRYIGTENDGGEHWNSTIFSHAAYKMMTDPDTAAVSSEAWANVFYRSLYRLSPGAKFVDGRAAVLDTAAEHGFTASQLQAIRDAFDGVGIVGTPTVSGSQALLLVAL